MASQTDIGRWFSRRRGSAVHVIESVINEQAVTKCGRRMDVVHRPTEWYAEGVQPGMFAQCQRCRGGTV